MSVVLAISSYNGGEAALRLARAAMSGDLKGVFTKVAVSDLGDPACCTVLRDALSHYDSDVEYHWHEGNLGSARNLVARLRWAHQSGAEALLALNADDAHIADSVIRMLGWLDFREVAAVYPTHVMEGERVDTQVVVVSPYCRVGYLSCRCAWCSGPDSADSAPAVLAHLRLPIRSRTDSYHEKAHRWHI